MRLDFSVDGVLWLDDMQRIEIPMRYSLLGAWIFALHGILAVVGVEDTTTLNQITSELDLRTLDWEIRVPSIGEIQVTLSELMGK
jgi:hypothetical protein